MIEKIFEIVDYVCFIFLCLIPLFFVIIFSEQANTPDQKSATNCTNIKKLYKDDILFDNFYLSCDEPITVEVDAQLFSRIEEGKNYTVIFNSLGGVYSIERSDK